MCVWGGRWRSLGWWYAYTFTFHSHVYVRIHTGHALRVEVAREEGEGGRDEGEGS